MKDDRILRAFGALDQPVAPDPQFARDLYGRLAADLGLRRRPGVLARVLGRVGVRPSLVLGEAWTPRVRLGFAVVVVALVALAGIRFLPTSVPQVAAPVQPAVPAESAVPVPSASPSRSAVPQGDAAAAELVRLSQAAQANPPAVRYVLQVTGQGVTLPDGELVDTWTTTVSADGRGTWRAEGPDVVAGGYTLYDGDRYGMFDGIMRSWDIQPVENGGPPFPMNDAFAWMDLSYPGEVATLNTLDCAGATSRGETVLAGRTADLVWCPTLQAEYALDRTTHLVLRLELFATSGTLVGPGAKEVISFEEITPDPADFDWSGPVLAGRTGPIEGTRLTVGKRPPEWSGTTITGEPFSTEGLTGPTGILFLCLDCTNGTMVYERFSAALAAHPGMRGVIVGQGAEVGTLAGFVEGHPTDALVISDVNSEFPTAWGYPYFGGLVVLGEGGKVGDVLSTRISAEDYDRVFTAAEEGRAIPVAGMLDNGTASSPSAPPASAGPGASAAPDPLCVMDLVVCHNEGWMAPAWAGAMPDGTTFDSATLAGTPALIWFGHTQSRSSMAALASLADRYAGRLGVVAITSREQMPGETAALLEAMDVHLPVVFDWDGSIGRDFMTITSGAILLDAEGRLVAQSTSVEDASFMEEVEGLLPGP